MDARWVLLVGIALFGTASYSASTPQTILINGKRLALTWADEFDYLGKPDPAKWTYQLGGDGWGNGELENYTDHLENAYVFDGRLVIEARKENYQGNAYTSARLNSVAPGWMYGHLEFRAKLPSGAGTWPCIWMLASQQTYGTAIWPDNGEIDIMEHVGRDPQTILGSFYSENYIWYLNNGKTAFMSVPDAESDFHIYAMDWDETQISLSIDGVTYNSFPNPHTDWQDWPFDQKFGLIINLAIGGGFAGPVDDSIFPQRLVLDYVRIYQPVTSESSVLAKQTP
jgi:beta-glucanase (GH16 family)